MHFTHDVIEGKQLQVAVVLFIRDIHWAALAQALIKFVKTLKTKWLSVKKL